MMRWKYSTLKPYLAKQNEVVKPSRNTYLELKAFTTENTFRENFISHKPASSLERSKSKEKP